MRRKQVGRPPKRAAEKQGEPVQVNLTRDELQALRVAAKGEPLAAYMRRVVLRHLARRERKKHDEGSDRETR